MVGEIVGETVGKNVGEKVGVNVGEYVEIVSSTLYSKVMMFPEALIFVMYTFERAILPPW